LLGGEADNRPGKSHAVQRRAADGTTSQRGRNNPGVLNSRREKSYFSLHCNGTMTTLSNLNTRSQPLNPSIAGANGPPSRSAQSRRELRFLAFSAHGSIGEEWRNPAAFVRRVGLRPPTCLRAKARTSNVLPSLEPCPFRHILGEVARNGYSSIWGGDFGNRRRPAAGSR